MNIQHILSDLAGKQVPIFDAVPAYASARQEAKIFEKMMGLKTALRDDAATHKAQLSRLLTKFFKVYRGNKKAIRYCLFAHTGDDVAPHDEQWLGETLSQFDLSHVNFFGSSLHKCAAVFQLCVIAKKILSQESRDSVILLLVADLAFTDILRYLPGSTVLSDGALLLVLKNSVPNSPEILDIVLDECGEFSTGIYATPSESLAFQAAYTDKIVAVLRKLLSQNNLCIDEIALLCPHNVNLPSWLKVIATLGLSREKLYTANISRYAHCFGIDPFLNLAHAILEKSIAKNAYVLLVTVGLGASFAAMLVRS